MRRVSSKIHKWLWLLNGIKVRKKGTFFTPIFSCDIYQSNRNNWVHLSTMWHPYHGTRPWNPVHEWCEHHNQLHPYTIFPPIIFGLEYFQKMTHKHKLTGASNFPLTPMTPLGSWVCNLTFKSSIGQLRKAITEPAKEPATPIWTNISFPRY
jgi:hypothetical protein